ncbi:MAG: glycosyltransferase family 9 protein [Bacteroidota bacterium]|nr:glycosyltransferase family 9 protein [Bacteroidota bacterium]MDP4232816.1 glycosyltransferase family 9 protein [Bacteroidota bacterium]MDP4242503.1 glycosyltransferase family 9 protein [Bacteroidota bacterium]MDP4289019.1 glycosyltransferase family 9 protein [Bacteroidota bacterium]
MKVLIVRTDRLGDLVLTLPMASELKRANPNVSVSFLVHNYTRPIAERCPAIDKVISFEATNSLWQNIRLFRASGCEVAVFPSPRWPLVLAAFLARIPVRIGTGYRWYSPLFNRRIRAHRRLGGLHEAVHNLRMLRSIGIEADPQALPQVELRDEEHSVAREWLYATLPNAADKFAVLHISTAGSSKDWSLEHFVELANTMRSEFGLEIVLTGTEGDRELLERAKNEIGAGVHLFVGKSLPELAALLTKASIVISNSTGPGHLAAAVGTPSVGLFPLPPALARERWGFRGTRAFNLAPEPISGCPNCKVCTCMERILVRDVMEIIRSILS